MIDQYIPPLFFAGALISTVAITPIVKKLAFRYGVVATSGGRRIHQGTIPLLGGVAIYVPIFIVFTIIVLSLLFGALDFVKPDNYQIVSLFVGSLWMLILGVADDKFKISWRIKLSGQFFAALILVLGGHSIGSATFPFIGPVYFDWVGIPIFILAVIAITNAINIIDGIDGLAGGICLAAGLTTGIIGLVKGDMFASIMGFTISGATAGFLFYNFPPASIFMGDGGTMTLGFLLATLSTSYSALYPGLRLGTSAMIAIPLIPFTIPIFETALSICRRWLRGQPIFSGDGDHLHYRLTRALRNPRRTVLTFYFFTFVCCAFTLLLALQPSSELARIVFLLTGLILLSGAIAALSLYKINRFILVLRNRPHFRFLSRFKEYMALKMKKSQTVGDLFDLTEAGVKDLGFDEVEIVGMGYIFRKWRNERKVHPDMPRITNEETFGNGRLKVKWVTPAHYDRGYNEFLDLTWRRFMNDLWREIQRFDKESEVQEYCDTVP